MAKAHAQDHPRGHRLTHKTDLAFALNEHPRIVGPRRYRYHSPLVSAEWCGFTPYPWGRGPVNFEPGGGRSRGPWPCFDTWTRLIELQPHYSWIIDRFHLSARAYQVATHDRDVDFRWLEERLRVLDVHLVLCTRREGTWEAAREARLRVSGKPSQYDDLDLFRREQDLLRGWRASRSCRCSSWTCRTATSSRPATRSRTG